MAVKPQSYTLSRERDQRRALLKGLAESLILHESIVTTTPKAKALRPYVEKLITRAKNNTVHNRRLLMTKLSTPEAIEKLLNEFGPRYKDRPGGYTRIVHEGWRRGDDARMSRISLVKDESPTPVQTEKEKKDSAKVAEKTVTGSKAKAGKGTAKVADKPKTEPAAKSKKAPVKKDTA